MAPTRRATYPTPYVPIAAMRPTAGFTSGKKISLKTIAAANEYSWKSMNSSAVPSQPETAAFFRSLVVRVTTPWVGAAGTCCVIAYSFVRGMRSCLSCSPPRGPARADVGGKEGVAPRAGRPGDVPDPRSVSDVDAPRPDSGHALGDSGDQVGVVGQAVRPDGAQQRAHPLRQGS